MLSVAGYDAAVTEWYRPVALRPVASVDPIGRARVAALRVDSAKQRIVLTGGACDVDRVCRPASALARTAFTATE
eukprot:9259525-Alexandrium_andersonii.AAC.1